MPASRITTKTPWHVILVLDDSCSMKDDGKISALNEAIERMIDEMRYLTGGGKKKYFRISIISFGSFPVILAEADNEQNIDIDRVVSMNGDSGSTNAAAALECARELLLRNPGSVTDFNPFLFFFSDGEPDDQSEALAVGEQLKGMVLPCGALSLVTVGIGEANDYFMSELATRREGVARYRRLKNAQEISTFFPNIGTRAVSQVVVGARSAQEVLEEGFIEL